MNLDDPRLTAYALGELDEFERVEIEVLIKNDSAAQQEVERIRQAGTVLTQRLDAEACPRLNPEQRAAIEERIGPRDEEVPRFSWSQLLGWGVGLGVTVLVAAMLLPSLSSSREKSRRLMVSAPTSTATAPEESPAYGPYSQQNLSSAGNVPAAESESAEKTPVMLSPPTELHQKLSPAPVGDTRKIDSSTYPSTPAPQIATAREFDNQGQLGAEQKDVAGSTWFSQSLGSNGRVLTRIPADQQLRRGLPTSANAFVPGTESYSRIRENAFVAVADQPLSTFGLDVDTASYANVRRFLSQGKLPPRDAVRIEEMLNYFSYDYPRPRGNEPFALYVEMAECPWNPAHRLALVGLKAKDVAPRKMQPMNLVFLLDVSGSMADANKLPLVKQGMRLLVEQLTARDRVAIVVYANNAKVVLPSTRGDDHEAILEAIDSLEANGSTNGGEGIQWAYRQAAANFMEGGVNRVILCTDGDFNVGITDPRDLVHLIEQQARSGVFLSVFGFGMGNLKDSTMQKLADKGNGHYAYIDDFDEARKMFVDQMRSTLVTVAKDAKLQVEFNPALVDSYRLIGYEKRMLRPQDFNNDRKDAGDIGAGHIVTALYEIVPAGAPLEPGVDPLKYQPSPPRSTGAELMTVKLRYKEPDAGKSQLLTAVIKDTQTSWRGTSDDFRFAAAVACFGMTLRDSEYRAGATFDLATELATSARGRDDKGYRMEFIEMVRQARGLAVRDP